MLPSPNGRRLSPDDRPDGGDDETVAPGSGRGRNGDRQPSRGALEATVTRQPVRQSKDFRATYVVFDRQSNFRKKNITGSIVISKLTAAIQNVKKGKG